MWVGRSLGHGRFLPEVKHWTGLTGQAGSIPESVLQKGPGDLRGLASAAEVRVRGAGLRLSPWGKQSGLGRLELPFFGLGWYLMAGRAQLKACGTELHTQKDSVLGVMLC